MKAEEIKNQIKLLVELNDIAEEREFNGVAYFNLLYAKVKELESELETLESQPEQPREQEKDVENEVAKTVLLVLAQIKHNEECGKNNKFTVDEVTAIIKRHLLPESIEPKPDTSQALKKLQDMINEPLTDDERISIQNQLREQPDTSQVEQGKKKLGAEFLSKEQNRFWDILGEELKSIKGGLTKKEWNAVWNAVKKYSIIVEPTDSYTTNGIVEKSGNNWFLNYHPIQVEELNEFAKKMSNMKDIDPDIAQHLTPAFFNELMELDSKKDKASQVEGMPSEELCNCSGRLEFTMENNVIWCNKCRKRFIP
jgi:hypothetical protein